MDYVMVGGAGRKTFQLESAVQPEGLQSFDKLGFPHKNRKSRLLSWQEAAVPISAALIEGSFVMSSELITETGARKTPKDSTF
ncbi:hypothetical protein Y032_0350g3213 [Ancylostoma ceylanicum]|uniref:Uncharacterized protein n=1 Tax=Ancylostoma ceylanicum TaxID=53326 RepID=A0A016RXH1_9BILA|nr:hypothetical protein Y032_0350g3213 [Ancylostoma ceylanicum]